MGLWESKCIWTRFHDLSKISGCLGCKAANFAFSMNKICFVKPQLKYFFPDIVVYMAYMVSQRCREHGVP